MEKGENKCHNRRTNPRITYRIRLLPWLRPLERDAECCCCLCQPCKAIWYAVSCGKIGRIIFINAFAMLNDFQRMDANSTACH